MKVRDCECCPWLCKAPHSGHNGRSGKSYCMKQCIKVMEVKTCQLSGMDKVERVKDWNENNFWAKQRNKIE